jgi:protein SCO1/2
MTPSIISKLRPLLFATLAAGCIAMPFPAAAGASTVAKPGTSASPSDPVATTAAPLPGTSMYKIGATLMDQEGHPFTLAARRGHPVLVSMFYNSCQFVCPMLIDTARMTMEGLSAQEKAELSTLLITFDPARDDVKSLKAVADKRGLDPANWTLARTDAASVRKIAAALDIQYRLLSDGEYNHTTVLVLLDRDGNVAGRSKKMGMADPDFVKLVRNTIAAGKRGS